MTHFLGMELKRRDLILLLLGFSVVAAIPIVLLARAYIRRRAGGRKSRRGSLDGNGDGGEAANRRQAEEGEDDEEPLLKAEVPRPSEEEEEAPEEPRVTTTTTMENETNNVAEVQEKTEPAPPPPSPPPPKGTDGDPLPEAQITVPYVHPQTGSSLAHLLEQLEADIEGTFGTFERTDDEEIEGEEEDGKLIPEDSQWIFDIPMEDTDENRENLTALATWVRETAGLDVIVVKYANGDEVELKE